MTLIPRDIEITTNRYGAKLPESCHIKVLKPPAVVTNENWRYLQFIDMFDELLDAHIDAENPEQLLLQYVKWQQLDSLTRIFTARRYYSQKIVLSRIGLSLVASI